MVIQKDPRQIIRPTVAGTVFPKRHTRMGRQYGPWPIVLGALNMAPETVVGQLRQEFTTQDPNKNVTREKIIC